MLSEESWASTTSSRCPPAAACEVWHGQNTAWLSHGTYDALPRFSLVPSPLPSACRKAFRVAPIRDAHDHSVHSLPTVFWCRLAGVDSVVLLFVLSFMAQVIAEMNLLLSHQRCFQLQITESPDSTQTSVSQTLAYIRITLLKHPLLG